jgi:hypothetical protein
MHYNFAPHKTLSEPYPTTPAMAAGISDHVWTVEDIAGLLESDSRVSIAGGILLIGSGTFMFWRRGSLAKAAVSYNQRAARMLPWLYYGPGKRWLSEGFQRIAIAVMGAFAIVLGGLFLVVRSTDRLPSFR